jgi:hypothetical protein
MYWFGLIKGRGLGKVLSSLTLLVCIVALFILTLDSSWFYYLLEKKNVVFYSDVKHFTQPEEDPLFKIHTWFRIQDSSSLILGIDARGIFTADEESAIAYDEDWETTTSANRGAHAYKLPALTSI